MKTPAQLKKSYEKICAECIEFFCIKHEIEFDFWIADRVGEVAVFNHDIAFNIHDIVFDITTNQPAGLILQWHQEQVDAFFAHGNSTTKPQDINYQTYCKMHTVEPQSKNS